MSKLINYLWYSLVDIGVAFVGVFVLLWYLIKGIFWDEDSWEINEERWDDDNQYY